MSLSLNYPTISPSLLLSFAETKRLDPRITFTRASTATYYDASTTAKAEENLLIRSQEFNDGIWAKAAIAVTANSTAAPDGTTTADTVTEDTATATHAIYSEIVATVGLQYTFSVFAKRNGRDIQLIYGFNDVTGNPYANFNLATGAVATTSGSITASISDAGNGWYRCSITATAASANLNPFVCLINSTSAIYAPAYAGDNTSGVFLWGAQLEQRSAVTAYTATTTQPITNYIPVLLTAQNNVPRFEHNPVTRESLGLEIEEQRTNLWPYSEQFGNAYWLKTGATITENIVVSPDGTLSGDLIVESATTDQHLVLGSIGTISSGATYTMSVFAKAYTRSSIFLTVQGLGYTVFNLSNGTVTQTGSGMSSATIQSVGNGWFRCSVVAVTANTTGNFFIGLWNGSNSYAGNGYSGVFLWGAQLELAAFPTSYIPTVAATVTRSADAASMTGTNFSSWFNNAEGTIYCDSQTQTPTGNAISVQISDNSYVNRIVLVMDSSQCLGQVIVNSSVTLSPTGNQARTNNQVKQAFGFATNSAQLSTNGIQSTQDLSGNMPLNQIRVDFGSDHAGFNRLSGTIKKIAYYPLRLSNSQLQALTTV